MEIYNFNIEKYLDLSNYETSNRLKRRDEVGIIGKHGSNEFFTPYSIVKSMCDKVDASTWSDPTKTFVEPSFGNGQFILMILYTRFQHGIDWRTALKTCYGVELMADNVEECKQRVCGMLSQLCDDFDEALARSIMDKNFICHDFFTWDFENWCELKKEPKKKKKKLN